MSGKKIKRRDFVDMVYERLKEEGHWCSWSDVYWQNKAFIDCLIDIIEEGNTFQVFGAFMIKPKLIQERKVYNFGEPKIIPEHYVAYLKPSRRMKEACETLMKKEKGIIDDE